MASTSHSPRVELTVEAIELSVDVGCHSPWSLLQQHERLERTSRPVDVNITQSSTPRWCLSVLVPRKFIAVTSRNILRGFCELLSLLWWDSDGGASRGCSVLQDKGFTQI